jgi:lipid II:glycine glycyltransferase (peptidoglycan interpeptide bridge formation enzyme)
MAGFLQSDFWGLFKERFGWDAFEVLYDGGTLLALHRRLVRGAAMAYIPFGPEKEMPAEELAALALDLKKALPPSTVFIRFDLPWIISRGCAQINADNASSVPQLAGLREKFIKSENVQPPDTVVINLELGEEEILSQMKPKWRYNIGLAQRRGVAVRFACFPQDGADENARARFRAELASYYALYRETAGRDGISIHPVEYYQALFETAADRELGADARLYLASHEGEDIAGIVVLFYGGEATYLYGASANKKRNLMAPHALQWQAMRDAKAAGCAKYDLFGIPPGPPEEFPGHPMAGLWAFKTGFGGEIIHRPGCWDFPCRPLAYRLWRLAETARKKWWDRKKKSALERRAAKAAS